MRCIASLSCIGNRAFYRSRLSVRNSASLNLDNSTRLLLPNSTRSLPLSSRATLLERSYLPNCEQLSSATWLFHYGTH